MIEHPSAPQAGARRHDLPRTASAGSRVLPLPAEPGLAAGLDRHVAMARRMHQPMAVLAVGLRRCLGAGGQPLPQWLDAVALELGQRLRARVRNTDTVLWQGGPEYAVVLNNCRPDTAAVARQRLLAGVSGLYRLGLVQVEAVVAIGSACLPAAGDSGAQLLAAARLARGPVDEP